MKWIEVVDIIEGNTENFENCIYMWRNKINGKLYIGQAKNFRKRTMEHKNSSYNENQKYNYNVPIHNAIRKYGIDNFEICILEYNLNDFDNMNKKEIFYIEYYDTLANNNNGYNLSSGGRNGNNFAGKTEEEMEEIRTRKSEAMKGKNNPMLGKHHSEETKQKQSEAMKGENNPMYGRNGENNPRCRKIICITTGEIFDYIKLASEKYGVDSSRIIKCCKGKYKSAGKLNGKKLVWMYYEDYLESLK